MYNLVLGMGERGDEWELQRIGTESEKMHVERELAELRERLAQVEKWKARREEIEQELNKVWVEGGENLAPPAYVEKEGEGQTTQTESESTTFEQRSIGDSTVEIVRPGGGDDVRPEEETGQSEYEEATQGEHTETEAEYEDATETEN